MAEWLETCRSVVSPWECDITEHFTIAYYFDRLADAAATIEESLGLRGVAPVPAAAFDVRFVRELRAGASFHILSAPIALDEQLRFALVTRSSIRQMAKSRPGSRRRSIHGLTIAAGSCERDSATAWLTWEGPAVRAPAGAEHRSNGSSRRCATGSSRPISMPTAGFALPAFVHRFTAGSIQALAAIGATSSYMESRAPRLFDFRARACA